MLIKRRFLGNIRIGKIIKASPSGMENNQTPESLVLNQAAEVNPTSSTSNQVYQEQSRAIARLIKRIRSSCNPETTFNTTVTELRQLLNTNRVGVFRFINELDWQGEFVYEDVSDVSLSAINVKIHDSCFGNESLAYQQGKIKVLSDIYQDTSHSCYIDLLKSFQVRACIVAPLLKSEQLWGLLCVHQCTTPRVWQAEEVEFVKQIAEHLGIVLQHTELLAQGRLQVEKQKALASVIARIRESLDEKALASGLLEASRRYCVRPWTSTSLGLFEAIPTKSGGKLIIAGGHNTGGFAESPAIALAVLASLRGEFHRMHTLYHPNRFASFTATAYDFTVVSSFSEKAPQSIQLGQVHT